MNEATDDADELRAEIERLNERLAVVESENSRKDDEIERLSRDLASERARTTELENKVEALESDRDASDASDESDENESKGTPMQQLVEAGEAAVIGHVTPSIRRAKTIAEHFGRWATKTPNGYVIRSNLKELLSMATGEQLEWSQVNRACRRLAEFSRGAIGFKKTSKHGNILVDQPDDHRLQSLLSSAG